MLRNPWVARNTAGVLLSETAIFDEILRWAETVLGQSPTRGHGYNTWVLLGRDVVLKIDPAPGRPDRFNHEVALRRFAKSLPLLPAIRDSGEFRGHTWLLQERMPGVPAFERWLQLGAARQRGLMSELASALAAFQQLQPDPKLLHAPMWPWAENVGEAFDRSLKAVSEIIPASYMKRAEAAFAHWLPYLKERPRVLCHGDLWFGNLLIDEKGRLSGILDFDRLALAPPEYELDMLVRFWWYPADFVPEEWESRYPEPLPWRLLDPLVRLCAKGYSADELTARLSILELTYRLGIAARFGWSDKHHEMLDRVLSGNWTKALLDADDPAAR